jgi:hypothetical protein
MADAHSLDESGSNWGESVIDTGGAHTPQTFCQSQTLTLTSSYRGVYNANKFEYNLVQNILNEVISLVGDGGETRHICNHLKQTYDTITTSWNNLRQAKKDPAKLERLLLLTLVRCATTIDQQRRTELLAWTHDIQNVTPDKIHHLATYTPTEASVLLLAMRDKQVNSLVNNDHYHPVQQSVTAFIAHLTGNKPRINGDEEKSCRSHDMIVALTCTCLTIRKTAMGLNDGELYAAFEPPECVDSDYDANTADWNMYGTEYFFQVTGVTQDKQRFTVKKMISGVSKLILASTQQSPRTHPTLSPTGGQMLTSSSPLTPGTHRTNPTDHTNADQTSMVSHPDASPGVYTYPSSDPFAVLDDIESPGMKPNQDHYRRVTGQASPNSSHDIDSSPVDSPSTARQSASVGHAQAHIAQSTTDTHTSPSRASPATRATAALLTNAQRQSPANSSARTSPDKTAAAAATVAFSNSPASTAPGRPVVAAASPPKASSFSLPANTHTGMRTSASPTNDNFLDTEPKNPAPLLKNILLRLASYFDVYRNSLDERLQTIVSATTDEQTMRKLAMAPYFTIGSDMYHDFTDDMYTAMQSDDNAYNRCIAEILRVVDATMDDTNGEKPATINAFRTSYAPPISENVSYKKLNSIGAVSCIVLLYYEHSTDTPNVAQSATHTNSEKLNELKEVIYTMLQDHQENADLTDTDVQYLQEKVTAFYTEYPHLKHDPPIPTTGNIEATLHNLVFCPWTSIVTHWITKTRVPDEGMADIQKLACRGAAFIDSFNQHGQTINDEKYRDSYRLFHRISSPPLHCRSRGDLETIIGIAWGVAKFITQHSNEPDVYKNLFAPRDATNPASNTNPDSQPKTGLSTDDKNHGQTSTAAKTTSLLTKPTATDISIVPTRPPLAAVSDRPTEDPLPSRPAKAVGTAPNHKRTMPHSTTNLAAGRTRPPPVVSSTASERPTKDPPPSWPVEPVGTAPDHTRTTIDLRRASFRIHTSITKELGRTDDHLKRTALLHYLRHSMTIYFPDGYECHVRMSIECDMDILKTMTHHNDLTFAYLLNFVVDQYIQIHTQKYTADVVDDAHLDVIWMHEHIQRLAVVSPAEIYAKARVCQSLTRLSHVSGLQTCMELCVGEFCQFVVQAFRFPKGSYIFPANLQNVAHIFVYAIYVKKATHGTPLDQQLRAKDFSQVAMALFHRLCQCADVYRLNGKLHSAANRKYESLVSTPDKCASAVAGERLVEPYVDTEGLGADYARRRGVTLRPPPAKTGLWADTVHIDRPGGKHPETAAPAGRSGEDSERRSLEEEERQRLRQHREKQHQRESRRQEMETYEWLKTAGIPLHPKNAHQLLDELNRSSSQQVQQRAEEEERQRAEERLKHRMRTLNHTLPLLQSENTSHEGPRARRDGDTTTQRPMATHPQTQARPSREDDLQRRLEEQARELAMFREREEQERRKQEEEERKRRARRPVNYIWNKESQRNHQPVLEQIATEANLELHEVTNPAACDKPVLLFVAFITGQRYATDNMINTALFTDCRFSQRPVVVVLLRSGVSLLPLSDTDKYFEGAADVLEFDQMDGQLQHDKVLETNLPKLVKIVTRK